MRRRPWNELLLLSCTLLGGAVAFAQYSAPATPAPYNPIALAEITGASRAAVQAGQNNYQTLSQNPYLGGVPAGRVSATPVALSLEDAVALGLLFCKLNGVNIGTLFGVRRPSLSLASIERGAIAARVLLTHSESYIYSFCRLKSSSTEDRKSSALLRRPDLHADKRQIAFKELRQITGKATS